MTYDDECARLEGSFGDFVEEREEDRRYMASLEEKVGDNFCSQCGEEECVRNGHCTACGSYEGWPDEDTEVSSPDLSHFNAADGGEEEDMGYHNDTNDEATSGPLSYDQQQQIVNDWIDAAPFSELKRIKIRVETVVAKRRAENEQEAKQLAQWEKPERATRSDAGHPRVRNGNAEAKEGAA